MTTRLKRSRRARSALLAAALAAWLPAVTPSAPTARAASAARATRTPAARGHARGAGSASSYPAGAQRPAVRVSARELAKLVAQRRLAARSAASRRRSRRRTPPKPKLHGNAARALASYEAMQTHYYLAGSGLYAGEPFSYLWPFSQALAATISLANVPGIPAARKRDLTARLVGLRFYLDPDNAGAPEGSYTSTLPAFDATVAPPAGPGGTKFYDDNDWVGIELMRLYRLTRSTTLLDSAETIMAFEMAGWDANPEVGCPGGIPFSNALENTDRNTITTAPAAELAAQLYRATRNPQYLQFAVMAYEWVRSCLLLPSGLYGDHVNRQGKVEPALWSYTQGAMIGAGTLLYQSSGNSAFLYDARQTAKAALAYFTPERLSSEIPFFPTVYFRNLLYLDSVTHDPPGPSIAQAYVNYAWLHLRLSDNVFVAGSPPSGQLLVQATITQIYAMLASPPATYF
jgi:Glycosyl hydrolase family 76